MPKDEFDFEDPFELNGVGVLTNEDTTNEMAECFIEEFMRLGYNHKQVFVLFRNPHYIGMNMVLQNRGEDFVKAKIVEVFGWWGRKVEWPMALTPALSHGEREKGTQAVDETNSSEIGENVRTLFPLPAGEGQGEGEPTEPNTASHFAKSDSTACDPMGAPIPKFNL